MDESKAGGKRYVEQSSGYTERLVKSRQFEIPSVQGGDDSHRRRRVFIFRWPGDWIEGRLIAGPIANWRRNASYVMELETGEQIEFFGNKQIHAVIRNNELLGRRIKIEYIGWQRIPRVKKPRKVYRIWRIEGLGVLAPENIQEQEGSGGAVEDLDETD